MSTAQDSPSEERIQAALHELQAILLQHYPEATFRVGRGEDDPEAIHLFATVDADDTDVVLDCVVDRMMEIQIEDGMPIFIIPLPTAERAAALRRDYARRELPPMPIAPV